MENIWQTHVLLSFVDVNSNPALRDAVYDVLPGFTRAATPPATRKHYRPPQLPKDFRPFHKLEADSSSSSQSGSAAAKNERMKLDAYSRGAALGEVPHLSK